MENMANFYAMGSNSLLARQHSEECEDSNIEDNTSQLSDDLAPGQKWEIIRHIRSWCNIIKSCDQSRDGSNQIGTISDYY